MTDKYAKNVSLCIYYIKKRQSYIIITFSYYSRQSFCRSRARPIRKPLQMRKAEISEARKRKHKQIIR